MKKFWIYILVTFGFGWLCQGLAMLCSYSTHLNLLYTPLLAISMFAPLLGAWLANGGLKNDCSGICWKPHIKGNLRWWLTAWFGPALLSILCAVVFFLLFPGRFDPTLSIISAQLGGEASPLPARMVAAIALVQSVTYAPLLNMFFAVGEEAGWRGWMTPFLTERLGRAKGLILSGVIWGAWHWPIILVVGYNFGTGYWGAPFTGAVMMCLSCTALGILLTWVYEKTRSIWAPALAHGAFNAAASLGTFFLPAGTTAMILGPTPLGLVAGIPLFIIAAHILRKET